MVSNKDRWGQRYNGWAIRSKHNDYIFVSTIRDTRAEAIEAFDSINRTSFVNGRKYFEAVKVRIIAVENPKPL